MHRVNVLLDDNAWSALQEIPRGERSKAVSKAIIKMASVERKIKAAKAMDVLRQAVPHLTSSAEISNWIREDRNR
jgi:replication-associated recombination protein RarA